MYILTVHAHCWNSGAFIFCYLVLAGLIVKDTICMFANAQDLIKYVYVIQVL